MAVARIQNNWSTGEVDPQMRARIDTKQYQNGAESMLNLRPLPQGGFTRRDGLRFAEELIGELTRLTPFAITTPNGPVANAAVNDGDEETTITTTTDIDTADPYVVVHYDLGTAEPVQFVDVVGFIMTSGPADFSDFFVQYSTDDITWTTLGEFIPVGNTSSGDRTRRRTGPVVARYWRFARIGMSDYGPLRVVLKEFNIWSEAGPLSNARLVDFDFSADQQYELLFTDRNARVYIDSTAVADIRTEYTSADLASINWSQSLDTLIVMHDDYCPLLIQRQGSDSQWNSRCFDEAFALTSEDVAVAITDQIINGNDVGGIEIAAYSLNNTGVAKRHKTTVTENIAGEWLTPNRTVLSGEFEVRATLSAGTAPTDGDALGAWLDLSTNRVWGNTLIGSGTITSTLLIEIRDAVTQIVLDSATIVVNASF